MSRFLLINCFLYILFRVKPYNRCLSNSVILGIDNSLGVLKEMKGVEGKDQGSSPDKRTNLLIVNN